LKWEGTYGGWVLNIMKLNNYAIIPASVRYDKSLPHGAKLLYAEISAAVDHTGSCEENTQYFSDVLECDGRTVNRYLIQLMDRGHLIRDKKNKTLSIPLGFTKQSLSSSEPANPVVEIDDDLKDFSQKFFKRFEDSLSTSVQKQELYYGTIAERLNTFSKNEMLVALNNRIAYLLNSEWHMKPENKPNAIDITLLIRDNASVLKWLNMSATKEENNLKSFNFN
jgi:hypothetical protein